MYFAIGILIAVIVLFAIVRWVNRKPKRPPQPQLYTGNERRGAREIRNWPGENEGPSDELLARMDAAGMNTTHARYEDFEQSKRRGVHRPLAPGEAPVSRKKPDDGDLLITGAIVGMAISSSDARPAEAASTHDHSSPSHGPGGTETGGSFGGGGFETGGSFGGDSGGGSIGGGND